MKKVIINEQVWTAQRIKEMMRKHDKALCTGILQIYSQQNSLERSVNNTINANGKGFSKCDVNFLSNMARKLLNSETLSVRQLNIARHKMPKYANQLLRMLRATA